ncbi:MAG: hypothetical protein H7Z20_01140 [Bdellovibrio sp.]|nr:hypothetical protein [Methylotenera sp.]
MIPYQVPNQRNIKCQDSRLHGIHSGAELFLVEGNSAAEALRNLRNQQLQAVLPMQGKPMNAYKSSLAKIRANQWFKALIDAIGAGVGDDFDVQKCRYSRVILLMDPDADGIHCSALMLLFFHRFMPLLLQKNLIEMARPPVGEVSNNTTKITQYAYTDAQFMALITAHKNQLNQSISTLKYRGLAGINASKLDEFCINPHTRKTSVMGLKDAEVALEIFGGR